MLSLDDCRNLGDFLVSFSRYEFTNLRQLQVQNCDGKIIESHILTRPKSFPSLIYLCLSDSNIVTIPRSISRFPRLRELFVRNCKKLREISRLPQSIRLVCATNCMSLDLPSSCRLLNQFGEIFMDPNFCEYFESESESFDGSCQLILPRVPKGFKLNHQSDGNSVSFWVGSEFEKLVLCFAFQSVLAEVAEATCFVVSADGFSKKIEMILDDLEGGSEHLCVSPIDLWEWEESNPSEENLLTIEVKINYDGIIPSSDDDSKITWLGVHVGCICHGCGSSYVSDDIVSVSDDIDHHSFPSDGGLQLDTNSLKFHPGWGFSDVMDDLGSSSRAWSCDDTELQPLPAVFSTSNCSDLDHGVLNSGGASGLLIEPNSGLAGSYLGFEGFESTFHGDVHDLDSSSFAYPFASIGYHDSNASRDGCPPPVLDDIEHHSLPSDVLPVDTKNGSELGLGWQDLGFSDGFDLDLDHGVLNSGGVSGLLIEPNSGLAGSYLGFERFESTFHGDVHDLDSSSFASIGYNDSDVGRTLAPLVPEGTTIHHSLSVLPVNTTNGSELGLGRLDLGFSDGFDPGSSSMAHAFDNNDSNFNPFPPSKKTRTS
ncbi:hypothetical protein CFP56_013064 [Quercus suber]|uniref:Uncharacterized protein n=1 Tax=Quercus suber TaxID=58331 RepID=A0AAW0M3B8_QUESU